ncbi:MAG TPA: type VI secretion system baseplate subunit TssG [Steroidobacteraceae bacterium]|jgi:type VI secretion system protein ImpH|nr:type VI secretion system baseplate subunit TssG [Steroidobacteraceae bacterium]
MASETRAAADTVGAAAATRTAESAKTLQAAEALDAAKAAKALSALDPLQADPLGFEFFEAMRRVECAWPTLPRLGTAARPADEPVRLGHVPALHFPASMLADIESVAAGRLKIRGYFLGLFGPQGPLPLHLTEYAHDRATNSRDHTFAAFADIFHHRILELFYRAWADARPIVQFDRPAEDRFSRYVGALIGITGPHLRDRDAWPDRARLFFAGLLAGATRTRAALESLLQEYLGLGVRVQECVGQWLPVAASERTCLGADAQTAVLGRTAILGERVWNAQHRIRVVIGPVTLGQLMQFLPGGATLERLRAIMLTYLGFEYAWDVQFLTQRDRLPGVRLGQFGHLGWTTWVDPNRSGEPVDDVIIDVAARVNSA